MKLSSLPFWFYLILGISFLVLSGIILISFLLYYRRLQQKTNSHLQPAEPPIVNHQTAEPAVTPSQVEPTVVRQPLRLSAELSLPIKDYERLNESISCRLKELSDIYFPFFLWRKENQIVRIFLQNRYDEDLNSLLDYWQAGYRNPEFALLLACYSEATQTPNHLRFLLQLATYKKISQDQLNWIHFLFQDQLNLHKSPAELTNTGNIALDFSLKIALRKKPITRREYRQLCLSHLTPDTPDFLSDLQAAATLPLALELYHHDKVSTHIPELLFRQFLKSGHLHYPQLWLNGSLYPALKLPTSKTETNELTHELLRHSREGRLLTLIILRYAKSPREFYEDLEPDAAEIKRLQDIKSTLSDTMRQAAFLNLSETGFHAAAEEFLPLTVPGKSQLAVRLHRARNWYRLGKYKEAHQLIEELLQDYPDNLPVLNETAIYNFRIGNLERAEELFERMKTLYPDNHAILHNEALFFEHKSLGEIKQRWEQVEKTKPALTTGFATPEVFK